MKNGENERVNEKKKRREEKKIDKSFGMSIGRSLVGNVMANYSSPSTDIDRSVTIVSLFSNETSEHRESNANSLVTMILFFIILSISIPSVFINIFAIYRLHGNTKLSVFPFRTILQVSLFTSCTCIPCFLIELYFNAHFPFSPLVCKLWLIVDYASIVCIGLLVCWASIQRHILIFGPIYIKKLQSTLHFKLIPSLLALGLPLTWYSVLATSCVYDQTITESYQCRPCFENEKTIFLIDTILSLLLPLLTTLFVTCFLVIRIIRLRYGLVHVTSKKWRRCKRLTRQLILFSTIYLIGLVPYVLNNFNSLYEFWIWMNLPWCVQISDAFTYVPCCFSSFLSIYAFPEIWTNRKNRHHHHHHRHQKTNRKHESAIINSPSVASSPI